MNMTLVRELYEEINALPIVDIHTHVNWKSGTARNIGEILSYHYYTELTNSAAHDGQPLPFDDPRELTRLVYPKLEYIRNTVQYDWLMTISREYLGIDAQEWEIDDNWEAIFDRSVEVMDRADWAEELTESELQSLRDPRNWIRPVTALAAGGVATGALILVGFRRRSRFRG